MAFSTIGGASTGGSAETPSGGAGSSGHEGVDDQSSSNDDQITIKDTEVVINDDSDDIDFRVESNGNANMLFVGGGEDGVGVGTSDIKSALTIGTAAPVVTVDTADAGDNKSLTLCGGGAGSISRGPYVFLGGNEITANANKGTIKLACGVGDGSSNVGDLYVYQGTGANNRLLIDQSETVFNEDSIDADFRVESNGNANMLFVDGGGDTVGIGCTPVEAGANNPSALLMVSNRGTPSTPAEYAPLIVENAAAAAYINIISNDNGYQGVKFGDATDPDEASIAYDSNGKRMYFTGNAESNSSATMVIDSSANAVGFNVVAPSSAVDVDGTVALKSQGSVPSITTGYAKLFAKSDIGLDTAVLMHFENNWNDSGAWGLAAGTASGNPAFVTSSPAPVIGTYSAHFDGTGDFVDLDGDSDDPALGLGYDDWTIDFRIAFPSGSLASNDSLIQSGATATSNNEGSWRVHLGQSDSAGDSIAFDCGSTFVEILKWDYTTEIADDKTWYHFAFVQHGGTGSFFLNGTKKASAENTNRLYTHAGIRLGADQGGSGDAQFYMNELRISKKAQWFNNFTPPTVAYGDSTLQCIDAHGNHTRLSPHNAEGEWEYFSQNTKTGKTVRINMEEVVSDLGKLTGKNYIKDE